MSAWTPDHVATLKECVALGLSRSAASKLINAKHGTTYSRNAVVAKCDRLGLGVPLHVKAARHSAAKKQSARHVRVQRGAPVFGKEKGAPRQVITLPALGKTDNPLEAITQLHANACRFPYGHPTEPGFSFCMREAKSGYAYCEHHVQLAYVKESKRAA